MIARWLLLAVFALSLYGAGQVWLVQVSSYPLWRYVGDAQFAAYHRAWWRSIWAVVLGPAALVLLGALLMLWWRPPQTPAWFSWLGAGLQLALVVGTALWWAPLMARLEGPGGGPDPARFRLLLNTHWLRVGLVSAYAILVGWMVLQNLRPG
ncbi:MAG: hypothetical protein JO127_05685 [Caulobacteraceae bacterium]|nr:hypothetical protein [Caulobacteraceae bacterium]